MSDENNEKPLAPVVQLPKPADKEPIFWGSPELEKFYWYLTSNKYSHSTASNYASALNAFFEKLPSNTPEARIYEFMEAHYSVQRIRTFISAWRLLHAWLAPRGYPITPLPRRSGTGGRPLGPMIDGKCHPPPETKPKVLARALFRGYNDLFGFRQYIRTLGFGEETTEIYFKIAAEALHFLEGDPRCSATTIRETLKKAMRRYPHLDPESVRFLRVWAHLQDYAKPLGYEVTELTRPDEMRPKKVSLQAVSEVPIENTTSSVDDEPIEDF